MFPPRSCLTMLFLSGCLLAAAEPGATGTAAAEVAISDNLSTGDLAALNQSITRLRSQGDETALDVLATGLQNPDPAVQARVLQAMPAFGSQAFSHIDAIRRFAQPEVDNVAVKSNAVVLLGELRDDDSLHLMIDAVGSQDKRLQKRAREALTEIANRDLGNNREGWERWYGKWEEAEHGRVAELADRLRHGTSKDVKADLHALLMQKTHRSTVSETLFELLRSSDPEVVEFAKQGLKNMDGGLADHLYGQAADEGLFAGEFRPEELTIATPVTPTVAVARVAPPAPAPVPQDPTGLIIVFLGLALLLGIGGYTGWRLYHEAHRPLSDKTRMFRRNRKRIEFTR